MRSSRHHAVTRSAEVTTFGQLTRSQLMSRVRSKGNSTTELRMVALLRHHGITGWRRHVKLPGRPDFAWPKERVVLFIHGCFWHGHGCGRNMTPRRNQSFWQQKFKGNRERDRRIRSTLRKSNFKVVTVWECQLTKSPTRCVRKIISALGREGISQSRGR
jgi:DNA mismatch endonuclease (patch repair protein)